MSSHNRQGFELICKVLNKKSRRDLFPTGFPLPLTDPTFMRRRPNPIPASTMPLKTKQHRHLAASQKHKKCERGHLMMTRAVWRKKVHEAENCSLWQISGISIETRLSSVLHVDKTWSILFFYILISIFIAWYVNNLFNRCFSCNLKGCRHRTFNNQ